MGQFYTSLPEDLIAWIKTQHLFWVATAPLNPSGHINLSPKSVEGVFQIVNENKVWYEDLTGSGSETISHLRENGRITIMFTAFEGAPKIVRLFGKGTVHEFGTPEYQALIPPETRQPGSRAAIVVDVYKVGSTCGFSVPFYEFKAHRNTLHNWNVACEKRDFDFEASPDFKADSDACAEKGLRYWQREWNLKSLDGLPGLQTAHKTPLSHVVRSRPSAKEEPNIKHRTRTRGAARMDQAKLIVAFLLGLLVATGYSMVLDILQTALTRVIIFSRLVI